MKVAVTTQVYNNSFFLPRWLEYYGNNFGRENLYVFDHGGTDHSTQNLSPSNCIRIPRYPFDDAIRTKFLQHQQSALLQIYDGVIYADGDEFLVPDPQLYANLADYINQLQGDYVCAAGVNVLHLAHLEPHIDATQPILQQRSFARYDSWYSKPLISKVPLQWAPGFHCCQLPSVMDANLILFHMRDIDYNMSLQRHVMWQQEVTWSEQSLAYNWGHHKRATHQQVQDQFDQVQLQFQTQGYQDWDLTHYVAQQNDHTPQHGHYWNPTVQGAIMKIPPRFAHLV